MKDIFRFFILDIFNCGFLIDEGLKNVLCIYIIQIKCGLIFFLFCIKMKIIFYTSICSYGSP